MASVETADAVNLYQLSVELGGVGIRRVGPRADGSSTLSADVDQAVLDAAIAAHVADPAVVPPAGQPDRTAEQRLAEAHQVLEDGAAEIAALPAPTTPADVSATMADILARAAAALNGGA